MITLAAALRDVKAFDGVVLMGPLIQIVPALASPMKIWAVRLLSRIAPNLSIGQLDVALVSRDVQQQEVMKNDGLRWKGGVKSKWATAIYDALTVSPIDGVDCRDSAAKMTVILEIFHKSIGKNYQLIYG